MARNLYTKNYHNMFEISSLVQKSLRRGDVEFACYAASEMEKSYRAYLWKRLLVTSAEDCFDLVTNQVLRCKEDDDVRKDNINLSRAVSVLISARKNRDADYFACNLLYSRYKKDFPDGGSIQTRHGHDVEKLSYLLVDELLKCNDENVGYLANEIRLWYRGLFWVCMKRACDSLNCSVLTEEVLSLEKVDLAQKMNDASTTIFISKAITSIMKFVKYGKEIFVHGQPVMYDIDNYQSRRNIPEYTYDCHTIIGKKRGLTDDDFIVSEQECLNPHKEGEYDTLDWANSRKWRVEGRGNVFEIPKMPKDVYKEVNEGIFSNTLF